MMFHKWLGSVLIMCSFAMGAWAQWPPSGAIRTGGSSEELHRFQCDAVYEHTDSDKENLETAANIVLSSLPSMRFRGSSAQTVANQVMLALISLDIFPNSVRCHFASLPGAQGRRQEDEFKKLGHDTDYDTTLSRYYSYRVHSTVKNPKNLYRALPGQSRSHTMIQLTNFLEVSEQYLYSRSWRQTTNNVQWQNAELAQSNPPETFTTQSFTCELYQFVEAQGTEWSRLLGHSSGSFTGPSGPEVAAEVFNYATLIYLIQTAVLDQQPRTVDKVICRPQTESSDEEED